MTTQRETTLTTTTINNLGTTANTSAFNIQQNKDKKQSEKRPSINQNYLANKTLNLNSNNQKLQNLATNQQTKSNLAADKKNNLSTDKNNNLSIDRNNSKQVGGTLKFFQDKQKKTSQSLKQKVFNFLNIQDIIQNFSEGSQIPLKQLSKITFNFLNIIEYQNKKPDIKDKNNDLQLEELKCLQTSEQKKVINLFWENIIQELIKNNKILSPYACLESIKLHIRWNKDKYIKNGKLNAQIYPKQLHQVINNKILINRKDHFFSQVVQSLQLGFQTYFKGMRIIFTEIAKIKRKKSDQMNILKYLNSDKEEQILNSLVKSFKNCLYKGLQSAQEYFYTIQNIFSCLLLAYQIFPNKFTQNHFLSIIQTLENTFQFFNNLSLQSNFRNQVQKLVGQCLIVKPFSPEKWNQDLKKSIKLTKVNIIKPFNLILDGNGDFEQYADDTLISGQNWIYYVNFILKNEEFNQSYIKDQFIYSIICKILKIHSNQFWANASEFDQIKKYIQKLSQIAIESQFNKSTRKLQIYQLIRIMICLMGKNNQENKKSIEYPLCLATQNCYKVCTQFSRSILNFSQSQFNDQFLLNQFNSLQIQFEASDNDIQQSFKMQKFTIVQLFSKIISSQPTFFFQLFKSYGQQHYFIKMILNFITKNITNDEFNQILFGALDNLIYDPQTRDLTIKIIEQLMEQQAFLPTIYNWCQDILKIECLSKHAIVLIQSGCYNQQWSKNILACLFSLSKKLFIPYQTFYVKLLTIIFARIAAFKIDGQTSKNLKPYINFQFICDYIQYILNFKYHLTDKTYTNKIIKTNNFKKLCEGVTFINSILLVFLKESQQRESDFEFLPQSIKRHLSLNNTQGKHQLTTQDNQLTSYLVGYLVILLNFYGGKKYKMIAVVCPDFASILYQGIQLLVKTSELSQINKLFNIYNSFTLSNGATQNKQSLFLQRFKNYVQQYQSAQGLQILLIGNLCQFQFAKKVVDKIRISLQNKKLFQYTDIQKKARVLSCLSRYFYFCINYMFNIGVTYQKKAKYQQVKQHLQFLLQTLVNYSYLFFNIKGKCKQYLQNIHSNIYRSFLLLQCFNRNLFLKWMKNYHRLLLHRINFNFKYNEEKSSSEKVTLFSQQYYKICQMFLCSSQYLNSYEYTEIINIQTLPYSLTSFIFNILQETKFQLINSNVTQLTLQLIINALKMYHQTKAQKKQELHQIFKLIQQKKSCLKNNQNLLVLQLSLNIYLDRSITSEQLSIYERYWPLKLNNIYANNQAMSKVFQMLRNPQHKIFFISGCNAITKFIMESNFDWRTKTNLQKILTLLRSSLNKSIDNYCSYETIWYLQFLELICLKQQNYEFQLADKIAKFLFSEDCLLKRLGFILLKLGVLQKDRPIQWMNFKFNYKIFQSSTVSFAQKLQLCQILKLINFLMVNSIWIDQYKEEFQLFINSITVSDQLFLRLLTNYCKIQPVCQQQKTAMSIKVNLNQNFMKQSGIRKYEKQTFNNTFSKIGNYFQLIHCIVNLQITSQYIILILSILNLEKHSIFTYSKYSERDWSNPICLKLLQALSHQYISLKQSTQYMNQILSNFTQKYYTTSLKLAQEMYFTNSKNLTTFLSTDPQQFLDLIKTNLQLLFETVYSNLKSMKISFHKQYQQDYKTLSNIIGHMKRELPSKTNQSCSEFQFGKYLGLEDLKSKNTIMMNTLRSRSKTGKTINNQSQQGSIRLSIA